MVLDIEKTPEHSWLICAVRLDATDPMWVRAINHLHQLLKATLTAEGLGRATHTNRRGVFVSINPSPEICARGNPGERIGPRWRCWSFAAPPPAER